MPTGDLHQAGCSCPSLPLWLSSFVTEASLCALRRPPSRNPAGRSDPTRCVPHSWSPSKRPLCKPALRIRASAGASLQNFHQINVLRTTLSVSFSVPSSEELRAYVCEPLLYLFFFICFLLVLALRTSSFGHLNKVATVEGCLMFAFKDRLNILFQGTVV